MRELEEWTSTYKRTTRCCRLPSDRRIRQIRRLGCISIRIEVEEFNEILTSRPSYDERSLAREDTQKCLIGGVENLVSKKIVHIVFLRSIMMCGIRCSRMYRKIPLDIIDDIWRMVDVANPWGRSCPEVAD